MDYKRNHNRKITPKSIYHKQGSFKNFGVFLKAVLMLYFPFFKNLLSSFWNSYMQLLIRNITLIFSLVIMLTHCNLNEYDSSIYKPKAKKTLGASCFIT